MLDLTGVERRTQGLDAWTLDTVHWLSKAQGADDKK